MPDLETRFRALDRLAGPDLWPDIERREPRSLPGGPRAPRWLVASVALLLAAAGIAVAVQAFVADRAPRRPAQPVPSPATPVTPVVDVTLPIRWPSSIVYGEGSVWVAASVEDTDANLLYRLDPDTGETLAEIPVPSIPGWETGGGGMVVADGSVWIAGTVDRQAGLLRVDASTNDVAESVPLGGDFAGDVAVGDAGVWVTVFSADTVELVHLDPSTLEVRSRVDLDTFWARELLIVDETVWVRARLPRGEPAEMVVHRIDPESGAPIDEINLGNGLTSVTAGGGWIWATSWNQRDGNLLLRIDPRSGELTEIPSGSLDYLVEVGPSGLWGRGLDQTSGELGIVRFDPVTGRIDASVELEKGQNPIDLAVAPGSVWVAVYRNGVTRIELRPA